MTDVFVTGASGFIGHAICQELVTHNYQVLGLTRSQKGADALSQIGVKPVLASLDQSDLLQATAAQCDAVIHTAFNHDFSTFVQNCQDDKQVIMQLGQALAATNKTLIVTSGAFMTGAERNAQPETPRLTSAQMPRAASDEAALACAALGVNALMVGLPQVHNPHKLGLVSYLFNIARQSGVSCYVEQGNNLWSAAHLQDIARLYRLALEKGQSGMKYIAAAEQNIAFCDIASAIAKRFDVPTKSLSPDDATNHFGAMSRLVQENLNASGLSTQQLLGWAPNGPSLFEDIANAIVE